MSGEEPDLDGAYALKTPEDSVDFYRDWADSYDDTFVASRGYVYPQKIARIYAERAGEHDGPVLDVGAGTGLMGVALRELGVAGIDGLDISAEMLKVAGEKQVYGDLIEGDLTARLALADGIYGGVVSSGTFTHGHVGPEALEELLRVSCPDALFCLGVNREVYEVKGFAKAFDRLTEEGRVSKPELLTVNIYENVDHDHAADTALVVIFNRL